MPRRRIVIDSFSGFMEGINPLKMPASFAQVDENSDGNKVDVYRSRKGWVKSNLPAASSIALTAITFRNSRGERCIMIQDGDDSTASLKGFVTPDIWNGSTA